MYIFVGDKIIDIRAFDGFKIVYYTDEHQPCAPDNDRAVMATIVAFKVTEHRIIREDLISSTLDDVDKLRDELKKIVEFIENPCAKQMLYLK